MYVYVYFKNQLFLKTWKNSHPSLVSSQDISWFVFHSPESCSSALSQRTAGRPFLGFIWWFLRLSNAKQSSEWTGELCRSARGLTEPSTEEITAGQGAPGLPSSPWAHKYATCGIETETDVRATGQKELGKHMPCRVVCRVIWGEKTLPTHKMAPWGVKGRTQQTSPGFISYCGGAAPFCAPLSARGHGPALTPQSFPNVPLFNGCGAAPPLFHPCTTAPRAGVGPQKAFSWTQGLPTHLQAAENRCF